MQKFVLAAALVPFAIACGGASSIDESNDDVTAVTDQLFSVRRDERACAAPACGGFFATAILQNTAASYVTSLDLAKAGLDAPTRQSVLAAPSEELLLQGHLSAADKRGFHKLVVKNAWRGMPGIVPAANDLLYTVAERAPQITCVAAPCNNQIATEAASGKATAVTRSSVAGAARAFVDRTWLENRVVLHGALVAAHVAAGQKMAGGTESVLEASQVWMHLPETAGPCAMPREQVCGAGQVQSYERTPDRCVEPAGCVTLGVCPRAVQPSCADGYLASTWAASPDACPATACDPAWVVQ